MKRYSKLRKGITVLLGSVMAAGLMLGTGNMMQAQAEETTGTAVEKNVDNTTLGVSAIQNPTLLTEETGSFNGDYVYLGNNNNKDGARIKFRVLQKEDNMLCLDSDDILTTSTYYCYPQSTSMTLDNLIKGSLFYTSCLTAAEKQAVESVSLLKESYLGQKKYGYTNEDNTEKQHSAGAVKKDNSYWINGGSYIDEEGDLLTPDDNEKHTKKLGVSPFVQLKSDKVLFSTLVEENNTTRRTYKLTLLDSDNIKLSVDDEAEFIIDSKGTITIPYKLTGTNANSVTNMTLLVTDKEYTESDCWIKAYISGTMKNGQATFRLNKELITTITNISNTSKVYLIAETRKTDGTDYASSPVEVDNIYNGIEQLNIEIIPPFTLDTNVGDIEGRTIKDSTTIQVTSYNGNESSSGKFTCEVTKSGSDNAKFNTSYTVDFSIKYCDASRAGRMYAFAPEGVTVNIKIKKPDGSCDEKTGKASREGTKEIKYEGLTFTTRKARLLDVISPTTDKTVYTLNYAATYAGILKQLNDREENEATVLVEGNETVENVPFTWNEESSGYKPSTTAGIKSFEVSGTISDMEGYDIEGGQVWASAQMRGQQKVGTPTITVTSGQTVSGDSLVINDLGGSDVVTATIAAADQFRDSVIYYTTDGTDPKTSETRQVYENETIEIKAPDNTAVSAVTLNAYAERGDDHPSEEASLTCNFKKAIELEVRDGTISPEGVTSAFVRPGKEVTVVAEDRTAEGKVFSGWKAVDGYAQLVELGNMTNSSLTFTMPNADIKLQLTAGYKDVDEPTIAPNGNVEVDVEEGSDTDELKVSIVLPSELTDEEQKAYNNIKYSYQWWKKNAGHSDFQMISDEKQDSYSLTNVTKEQNGDQYCCKVTYEIGGTTKTLTSGIFTLSVTSYTGKPTIEISADKTSYTVGDTAVLTATATASKEGELSYQWYTGNNEAIDGAVKETYTTPALTLDGNNSYYCIVTEKISDTLSVKAQSDSVTLTVTDVTGVLTVTGPKSVTVKEGKEASFEVTVTQKVNDSDQLTYQWYKIEKDGSKPGSEIEGAKETKYTIASESVSSELDGTKYYCIVKEWAQDADTTSGTPVDTVESDAATLTIGTTPTPDPEPEPEPETYTITVNGGSADKTTCKEGETVTITATVPDKQKFVSWTGNVSFDDANSATTTFTMPANDVTVTATFENDYTINITQQPANVSVSAGGNATFTVAAESSYEMTYEWKADYNDGKGFQTVGAGPSYDVKNAVASMNGTRYECIISIDNNAYSVTSSVAVLTVEAAEYTIKVNSGTASVASSKAGETITIKANAAPSGQQFKKWTIVSGRVNFGDATKEETTFTMPASNVEVTAEYQNQLTTPVITTNPESVTIYAGSGTSFKVAASGEELSYQWKVDKTDGNGFQDISGATNATYRVYTEDASMNGYKYKCVVSNRSGSAESKEAVLTVDYKITEGARSTFNKSGSNGLTFKGSGAYDKFRYVQVDGSRISGSNFTKKSDPTIITLTASYLKGLSNGEHTLVIVWEDGKATTTFTVAGKDTSSNSSSSSGTTSAGSSSSVSKSSASSDKSSAAASSSTTDTNTAEETAEETVDMPVVRRAESADESDGKTQETAEAEDTGENTYGANDSVITTSLDGSIEKKDSWLNRYAAACAILVIILSAAGIGLVLLSRRRNNK